jgi:hypothetical protein
MEGGILDDWGKVDLIFDSLTDCVGRWLKDSSKHSTMFIVCVGLSNVFF